MNAVSYGTRGGGPTGEGARTCMRASERGGPCYLHRTTKDVVPVRSKPRRCAVERCRRCAMVGGSHCWVHVRTLVPARGEAGAGRGMRVGGEDV